MATATAESAAFLPCENDASHRRTLHPVLVEDLAFTHWQHSANEKAYEAKLITKAMYEFARDELQKRIKRLSAVCYKVE